MSGTLEDQMREIVSSMRKQGWQQLPSSKVIHSTAPQTQYIDWKTAIIACTSHTSVHLLGYAKKNKLMLRTTEGRNVSTDTI